ncbi:MAG: recombinase family protein [Rhodospirillaceae bacterium]|jgi:DNA invertase Pin-like site-specific DNA recombinase|nr:recombinase family protein [Rhodospirillaceae bacterium]MBT6200701.1 recombinase family protein [Bacteroidetes Order II. bacterium]MBT6261489.1 recombinase family protein [Rhodospirillaceae bacterium]MBT6530060.1 recombinase family protein [Betaproteobacteria bacterium]MBT7978461.1 recombinase family protein [Rhodospirillaceae bacterium]
MNRKVAVYARVSTDKQTTENQLNQLRAIADKNGWVIVREFVDEGISGAKGRDKRPQFDALLKSAVRRDFDLVLSWSVDRLGRSLQHLVEFLNELHGVGCDLFLHQQAIDTTTPSGKAMFGMCGIFAEFERSIIQQRVKAGLERARANGVRLGRPAISQGMKDEILAMRATGMSMNKIAGEIGISKSVVVRTVNR